MEVDRAVERVCLRLTCGLQLATIINGIICCKVDIKDSSRTFVKYSLSLLFIIMYVL